MLEVRGWAITVIALQQFAIWLWVLTRPGGQSVGAESTSSSTLSPPPISSLWSIWKIDDAVMYDRERTEENEENEDGADGVELSGRSFLTAKMADVLSDALGRNPIEPAPLSEWPHWLAVGGHPHR